MAKNSINILVIIVAIATISQMLENNIIHCFDMIQLANIRLFVKHKSGSRNASFSYSLGYKMSFKKNDIKKYLESGVYNVNIKMSLFPACKFL